MRRDELSELHYIAAIVNIESICAQGILSHNRAQGLSHRSVAMPEIQERRKKDVPGGRPLHDYVNLYICARNPMMFKIIRNPTLFNISNHADLCVLRVNPAVLDLPGVVVTDCNAASDYVRFIPAPGGLAIVDRDLVFANDWRHDDPIQFWQHRSIKCAEVLAPDRVEPHFLAGIYVSGDQSMNTLKTVSAVARGKLEVSLNPSLFFQ